MADIGATAAQLDQILSGVTPLAQEGGQQFTTSPQLTQAGVFRNAVQSAGATVVRAKPLVTRSDP